MFTSLSKHVSTKAFHYSWSLTNKTLKSSHWVGKAQPFALSLFIDRSRGRYETLYCLETGAGVGYYQSAREYMRRMVVFCVCFAQIDVLLNDTSTVRCGNIQVKIESGHQVLYCFTIICLLAILKHALQTSCLFLVTMFFLATSYMSP